MMCNHVVLVYQCRKHVDGFVVHSPLKVQCSVLHLDSQVDYRSKALAAAGQVYLT